MSESTGAIPAPLAEIIAEFAAADDREKLDLLLEFSDELPDLPEHMEHLRDEMLQVEECQAPVGIAAVRANGHIQYYFAIPESAPTVRGFASIMLEGTEDATPEEILQIPTDFFLEMGLQKVLSPQRLNGIGAILAYMKRLAVQELDATTA
jgi:cysteine desulfuration protein SufE